MNRETRTRWYNHKCSKCSAHPFVIIIRIVLYALVRYLRPTLYNERFGLIGKNALQAFSNILVNNEKLELNALLNNNLV